MASRNRAVQFPPTPRHDRSLTEQLADLYSVEPPEAESAPTQGLINEGELMIADANDPQVLDASLIAAAQRVEHYEIATYGTVIEFARILGRDDDPPMPELTLGEEKGANILLTRIATRAVNEAAAAG